MRGNLTEGRATLEELLARPDAAATTTGRARALSALGGLEYWQSDMEAAERAYVEGLEIQRSLDDPLGLAEALYNVGYVRVVAGRHAEAQTLYEEALEIANRVGDRAWVQRVREALAFLLFHMGEFAAGRCRQRTRGFPSRRRDVPAAGTGFLSYLRPRRAATRPRAPGSGRHCSSSATPATTTGRRAADAGRRDNGDRR
jgi:tetratricopeptide (TPR) repeat protein